MARKLMLSVVLVAFLTVISTSVPAMFADGGKAKNVVYDGTATPKGGNGTVSFNIDTSPIIFYLGTVNNKYHILLIRAKNDSNMPVTLAKDQDTIEMQFSDGQKVQGLLNLPSSDRATWDGLETEIRTAVVYPQVIEAGEEEGIYFYVPVDTVKEQRKMHMMPKSISYNIKSLSKPVVLHTRGASKA